MYTKYYQIWISQPNNTGNHAVKTYPEMFLFIKGTNIEKIICSICVTLHMKTV